MRTIRLLIGAAVLAGVATTSALAQDASTKGPISLDPAQQAQQPAARAGKSTAKSGAKSKRTTKKRVRRAPQKQQTRTARPKAAPTLRSTAAANRIAQGDANPPDGVMRGPDTIALVGMLPWWRAPARTPTVIEAANSKMLDAADAWYVQRGMSLGAMIGDGRMMARAEASNVEFAVADNTENTQAQAQTEAPADVDVTEGRRVNEIDLAADTPPPSQPTLLQSLIAVLGGTIAAAGAARFLFAA